MNATTAICDHTDPGGSQAPNIRPTRAPWPAILIVAAAAFCLELTVSARYGYVRDELYFLAAGRHLAFGYVDQPALTPLIARLSAVATGNSLIGLRLVPAFGLAVLVVATAAMGRLLGAGRIGQVLAALAAAPCGECHAAMPQIPTTLPDFCLLAVTLLLVTRLVTSQDVSPPSIAA